MEPVRLFWPQSSDASAPLFLQRAGRTVLIGYREDGRWVLARGWRKGDRFTDIRCWRFQSHVQFIAQVGRLVREGDAAVTGEAVGSAESWVHQALPR